MRKIFVFFAIFSSAAVFCGEPSRKRARVSGPFLQAWSPEFQNEIRRFIVCMREYQQIVDEISPRPVDGLSIVATDNHSCGCHRKLMEALRTIASSDRLYLPILVRTLLQKRSTEIMQRKYKIEGDHFIYSVRFDDEIVGYLSGSSLKPEDVPTLALDLAQIRQTLTGFFCTKLRFQDADAIMQGFSMLQYLSLAGNRLKKIPDAVAGMEELKYLNMSGNELAEVRETELPLCLETLLLSGNSALKKVAAHVVLSLRTLDIYNCPVEQLLTNNSGELVVYRTEPAPRDPLDAQE